MHRLPCGNQPPGRDPHGQASAGGRCVGYPGWGYCGYQVTGRALCPVATQTLGQPACREQPPKPGPHEIIDAWSAVMTGPTASAQGPKAKRSLIPEQMAAAQAAQGHAFWLQWGRLQGPASLHGLLFGARRLLGAAPAPVPTLPGAVLHPTHHLPSGISGGASPHPVPVSDHADSESPGGRRTLSSLALLKGLRASPCSQLLFPGACTADRLLP